MNQNQADLLKSINGTYCTDANDLRAYPSVQGYKTTTLKIMFPTQKESYIVSAVSVPGYIFSQIRQQSSSPITSIVLTVFEGIVTNSKSRGGVDNYAVYGKRFDNVFVLDPFVIFELDNPVRINSSFYSSYTSISYYVIVELNLIEWPASETEYELHDEVILNIRQCANFDLAAAEQFSDCEMFYQDWTELIEDALESNCGDYSSYASYQTCIGEASAGE